jgi:hypothetical protein
MLQTFKARLKGNQLEWLNEIPKQVHDPQCSILVYVTLRENVPVEESEVLPKQAIENALLSEKALAKDWNKPEEDEAWSHLQ